MINRLDPSFALIVSLVGVLVVACAPYSAPYPEWPLPPPRTGHVTDVGEVFGSTARQRLESRLGALETAADIDFMILTVPSIGSGMSIGYYTGQVVHYWGAEDRTAAILVVSVKEKGYYFATSPDLKNDLPSDGGKGFAEHTLDTDVGLSDSIEQFTNLVINSFETSRGFSLAGPSAEP